MSAQKITRYLLYGHVAILTTTIIWGMAGAVIKYTLAYIPPYTFLFMRFLIVCLILLPYVFFELKKQRVNPKDYWNLFLLGVFSQTSLIFIFIALKYTTVWDTTIIGILGSIMSVYAGHYFFKEKVDKRVTTGLILASIGTLIVVLEPLFMPKESSVPVLLRLWGNFLIILNNITWIFYVIWSKMSTGENRSKLLQKTLSFVHIHSMKQTYPPTLLAAITFYVGLITLSPFALLEAFGFIGNFGTFSILSIPFKGVLGLLYMAVLSSVVGYMLYQWGLQRIKVSDTALYAYLGSIFSLPAAYFLLGELPNFYVITGALVIVAGIVVAESRPLSR